MNKLISLFQNKYEQVLLWILTRATEILIPRYEAKLKKNQKKDYGNYIKSDAYLRAVKDSKNNIIQEILKERKEKYDSVRDENGKIKIQFGCSKSERKKTDLKLDFPCEKLWQAVFGEQEKMSFQEYESKKGLLNSELQKLFKTCKRKNEVDETYRDLTFKNRFARKVSDSIVLSEEEKNGIVLTILETRINYEIEKVKSERLDFLEKNTKTETIKVCGCQEDCFCEAAHRTTLFEDRQEIILFNNIKETKERLADDPNYENLGLEIEEYGSEKKSTFSVGQDEIVLFLSKSGCVASSCFDQYKNYEFKLPIYQFTFQQLKKAKDEIEGKYNKSWIKYSRLIVNFQTGESNLIFILKDTEKKMSLNEALQGLTKIVEEAQKDPKFKSYQIGLEKMCKDNPDFLNFGSKFKITSRSESKLTEQNLKDFQEIIRESQKDPDFSIIKG